MALAATLAACSDPAAPDPRTLLGSWDMIGFSDDGVEALTTGTWTFRSDGTHSFDGTIEFPGEPVEPVSGEGTWDQTGSTLEMAIGDTQSSFWDVEHSGDVATLTADEPPPANWIRLRRR